jgi:signal transduction histidine kinase
MEIKLEESNKQIEDLNGALQIINKILMHDLSNKLMIIKSTLWLYEETKNNTLINKLDHSIDSGIDIIDRVRDLESFLLKKEDLKMISAKKIAEYVSSSINFPVTIEGDAKVLADEALFSVFENIMRNAIIHGKTDKIKVEIKSKNKFSEIKIIDYGKGVPDSIKETIFGEGISFGENKGTGLGLYIVKKTIERYGGKIKLEDNKPKGAIFIIKLKSTKE